MENKPRTAKISLPVRRIVCHCRFSVAPARYARLLGLRYSIHILRHDGDAYGHYTDFLGLLGRDDNVHERLSGYPNDVLRGFVI